jgi:uncharacterized protein YbcC (UPF0753/DUF2309 family)
MRDESGRIGPLGFHGGRLALCAVVITTALLAPGSGCTFKASRGGLPSDVEATIGTISDDIAEERYEKIYNEASDLWRQAATLEQSTEVFKKLRSKLGKVENRSFHSGTEQNNSGGPLKGRAFIVTYQTKFEQGEGMETFTLAERDHKWLLARYFVNSTALN